MRSNSIRCSLVVGARANFADSWPLAPNGFAFKRRRRGAAVPLPSFDVASLAAFAFMNISVLSAVSFLPNTGNSSDAKLTALTRPSSTSNLSSASSTAKQAPPCGRRASERTFVRWVSRSIASISRRIFPKFKKQTSISSLLQELRPPSSYSSPLASPEALTLPESGDARSEAGVATDVVRKGEGEDGGSPNHKASVLISSQKNPCNLIAAFNQTSSSPTSAAAASSWSERDDEDVVVSSRPGAGREHRVPTETDEAGVLVSSEPCATTNSLLQSSSLSLVVPSHVDLVGPTGGDAALEPRVAAPSVGSLAKAKSRRHNDQANPSTPRPHGAILTACVRLEKGTLGGRRLRTQAPRSLRERGPLVVALMRSEEARRPSAEQEQQHQDEQQAAEVPVDPQTAVELANSLDPRFGQFVLELSARQRSSEPFRFQHPLTPVIENVDENLYLVNSSPTEFSTSAFQASRAPSKREEEDEVVPELVSASVAEDGDDDSEEFVYEPPENVALEAAATLPTETPELPVLALQVQDLYFTFSPLPTPQLDRDQTMGFGRTQVWDKRGKPM